VNKPRLDPGRSQQVAKALQKYATSSRQTYLVEVNKLQIQSRTFLSQPNEETLGNLRNQWLNTHRAFSQAQFGLLSPPGEINLPRTRIDTWPIQPGFIDDLEDYPLTGVVHDSMLDMTPQMLIAQHGVTSAEEVLLGFHGIELLIFTRPLSDFEPGVSDWTDRRRMLLELMVDQLSIDANESAKASSELFSTTEPNALIAIFLEQTLVRLRDIFRESNLVAAQGSGHCLSRECSLDILYEELIALERYLVGEVGVVEVFQELDPATYENFVQTIGGAADTVRQSDRDEVALANVPLILSALTHQVEAFVKLMDRE
jgi:hypothetical protein